jgi:large subunit ribosomal protein L15
MITLSALANTDRPKKKVQRVGRGMASNRGKTCGRGHKGDSARCGYKRHFGNEGGQMKLYRKLPCRGFGNSRFATDVYAINLSLIEQLYKDGEVVNLQTLREKGYAPRKADGGLKILSDGELTKKVTIEARSFSKGALEKLEQQKVSFKVIGG